MSFKFDEILNERGFRKRGTDMSLGFMVLEICCIAGALNGNKLWLAAAVGFAALAIWQELSEEISEERAKRCSRRRNML